MEIAAIIAMNNKRVIGNNGSIPWHSSEDLKRFKSFTEGFPVIMGRFTWESLPVKPLKNRHCIVVSRYPDNHSIKADTCRSLDQAIRKASALNASTAWIIGGAKLFDVAIPRIERVELTLVNNDADGDVVLPKFEHLFKVVKKEQSVSTPELTFITYERKQ